MQKSQQQQNKPNILVKVCAGVGMLSLIPLFVAIIFVSLMINASRKPNFERVDAIVVEDLLATLSTTPSGSSTVEFTYNGVTSRRRIDIKQPVKINDKIVIYVINKDPTNLQAEEPKENLIILYILLFCLVTPFVMAKVLYSYYPAMMCGLVLINICLTAVALIFAKKKK